MDAATIRSGTAVYGNGRTKIDRFKWKQDISGVGQFMKIDKNSIDIDHTYQRENVSREKVLAIVSKWSWPAFGVLIVAMRQDGTYFVVDGQHRLLASLRRADVDTVPCMVFTMEDSVEEAQAFLDVNTKRKPLSMVDKWNPLVATGNQLAAAAKQLIEQAGYEVVKNNAKVGKKIYCVNAIMSCLSLDEHAMKSIWPLLVEAHRGEPIKAKAVEALHYSEMKLRSQGLTLTREPWRSRVLKLGAEGIVEAANRAAAFYAQGGAKVWASGLVEALNKGVRHKIRLDNKPE